VTTWDDRGRSTEVDVDLEANEMEVVVTETITFSDFFDEEGELRLWQDSGGWSGILREDGAYFRVNVTDDGEVIAKDEISEADVIESIRGHVEDPGAGSAGSFVAPARPGSRHSDPPVWGDRR
jgi:hypothetical protein